jgi:Domain of unknown function (DUF222)
MSSQVPERPDDEQAATSPGDAAADGGAATSPSGPADSDRAAGSADGPPWVAWVEGSELSGPGQTPGGSVGGVWPDGLDYQALLEALAAGGFLDGRDEDQDAELADELAAEADGRMGPPDPAWAAALAVEHMDPGPAMAGWLKVATGAAGRLDENGLAGVTIAAQKLASWAQAAGLDAVAQITSRAAAADNKIGVRGDGRPARLCRDAIGQVSLTLMLTDCSAAAWADLAITLAWRLSATRAALAAGRVDFYRAKLIAEATAVLSEDKARQVEAKVLPEAGGQTPARLRARLRQAVIAIDPEGAEQRRKDAERAADVRLYAEDDQTATMVASKQPPGYRPPPRLREFVTARDVTCRGLACRQPAWRADLDHTIPYDQGGRTCRCNFGGGCRKHHILKQHPRWKLEQTRPGVFTWTTPAGRTYTTGPDVHPL